jgi:hypothetical protein
MTLNVSNLLVLKKVDMEFKINIGYKELLNLIWQLPGKQLAKLREDIMLGKSPKEKNHKSFQTLLLNGPVMNESQFKSFQANREHFNKWRSN